MSLFAPLVFTGSALSRSRAEISFSALRQAVSRGKMAFGFFRILTQTLTHTGIRVHGTSGTDRARERGFPSPQGRKSAGMSPHRIQTAAHNPKVVGSSPASATKQKRHPGFPGCFYFRYYDGGMILRIVIQFSEERQRTAPRRGGSPTNAPSLTAKKGQSRKSTTPHHSLKNRYEFMEKRL